MNNGYCSLTCQYKSPKPFDDEHRARKRKFLILKFSYIFYIKEEKLRKVLALTTSLFFLLLNLSAFGLFGNSRLFGKSSFLLCEAFTTMGVEKTVAWLSGQKEKDISRAETQKQTSTNYFTVKGRLIHENGDSFEGAVVYVSSLVENKCAALLRDPETSKFNLPPNAKTDENGVFKIKVKRFLLRSKELCFSVTYPRLAILTPSALTGPNGAIITVELKGGEKTIDLEALIGNITVHIK